MKNKLFIVSRFNEPFEWIRDYTDNYIIYNKGDYIPNFDDRILNTENIGGNQRDIFHFAYTNYENLPNMMVFVQGNPFDHCKKEVFDILIKNRHFTPLEYYGPTPANNYEQRDSEGGFMEINNSWYINAHNNSNSLTCRYNSFDDFMQLYFENYTHVDWIRFSPGSQYMVKKQQILQYPKTFWYSLMNELKEKNSTEAHIIERALYYIFVGKYKLKMDI